MIGSSPPPRGISAACTGAAAVLASLLFGGCAAVLQPSDFTGQGPELSPMTYFDGTMSSFGLLENPQGAPTKWFSVESRGRRTSDGALVLEQTVRWRGGRDERRSWRLQRGPDGRLEAALTDASGPVHVEAAGPVLHLSYALKSVAGGRMEQWLYLQSDGRTLLNEGTVTVLGVVAARLSERITKEG